MRLPLLLLLGAACLPQVGPPVDAGSSSGSGGGAGGGSAGATGASCPGYAGCTAFTDGATVTFPNVNDTYSPRCLRVRAGQQVTFSGALLDHPLEQACGPAAVITGAATVTFTVPGSYGYWCARHGSSSGSGMAGAIEVVP